MHSKKYKEYAIDDYEYRELMYFCLQYNKKAALRGTFAKAAKDIELIDTALRLTTDSERVRECIKKNVTNKNMPYEYLGAVPMGRQQFYEARRRFFYILKTLKMG